MKTAKLFMSLFFSLLIFLGISVFTETADASNGMEMEPQGHPLQSEDCNELLNGSQRRINQLNFIPLPMNVRLEYADDIAGYQNEVPTLDDSVVAEIQNLKDEQGRVRDRLNQVRNEELSLGEMKAMSEASWGMHTGWEASQMGRLPLLKQERKKLEQKDQELDQQVSQRIPALKQELNREEELIDQRKSHLGEILAGSIKQDLSAIVNRLSQNSLLPDHDRLICSQHNWRLYEVKNEMTPPKIADVEKLIDLDHPVAAGGREEMIALSLCRLEGSPSTYVRLGFRGAWNSKTHELILSEMSYQRLTQE